VKIVNVSIYPQNVLVNIINVEKEITDSVNKLKFSLNPQNNKNLNKEFKIYDTPRTNDFNYSNLKKNNQIKTDEELKYIVMLYDKQLLVKIINLSSTKKFRALLVILRLVKLILKMLAKFGNVLLNESKIEKYKKISSLLFFLGILVFLFLPLFSNRIFIVEKQLKNSDIFFNQIEINFFFQKAQEILKVKKHNLNSVEINSQRGERNKFIMINSIYDANSNRISDLYPIYFLIYHFSISDNIRWLTKDIQFNFIPREQFYLNSKIILEDLTSDKNNKVKEGQMIHSVINIDFSQLRFEENEKILMKINGANSENIDMDFYKTFYDNFLKSGYLEENLSTIESSFKERNKFYLRNILYNIGSLIVGLVPKDPSNYIEYTSDYLYFLENIFENYFIANEQINTNHLLISQGFNSILIKAQKNYQAHEGTKQITKVNLSQTFKKAFEFVCLMERVIKNMSKSEIENFRGDFNYILTNSHSFVGIGFFLFIPILCVIKIFYQLLEIIYNNDVKIYISDNCRIQSSKVIGLSLVCFTLQILLFLHIKEIKVYVEFSLISTFYHLLIINLLVPFVFLRQMDLNKWEEKFLDNILRFAIALNCFNFLFVNFGFGLIMTVVFLPLEACLIYIHNKLNRTFLQIFLISILIYSVIYDKVILETLLENYSQHMNNPYPLLSFLLVFLNLRLNLIFRRWLNLEDRIATSLDSK
jgi:hypothetical protein